MPPASGAGGEAASDDAAVDALMADEAREHAAIAAAMRMGFDLSDVELEGGAMGPADLERALDRDAIVQRCLGARPPADEGEAVARLMEILDD